jgi:hypothetical protein
MRFPHKIPFACRWSSTPDLDTASSSGEYSGKVQRRARLGPGFLCCMLTLTVSIVLWFGTTTEYPKAFLYTIIFRKKMEYSAETDESIPSLASRSR